MKLNIAIDIPDEEIARLLGTRTAAIPETPAKLELLPLVVGGRYLNREGSEVTIGTYDGDDNTFCGEGPAGSWYSSDGTVVGLYSGGPYDLVSRIA